MTAETRSIGFAGHAATYAAGNIIGRLVGFLMLPIYTRYLTTADYGAVGLLAFALALLEPFFGARLAGAVPKFYFDAPDGRKKRAVIWSALIATGSISLVVTLAMVLFRHPASHALFGSDRYAFATGLFAITMLSQPVEYTGMMYLRLLERSQLYLGISMAKLALQIVLNVLLIVHWRLGVVGIVLSGVVSSLCVGIGLTIYIAWLNRPVFDWNTTVKMARFCWPLWFSGIAGLYVGSSGAMYLRLFDSLSDVGLLELGLKFAAAVGLLVWTPFFQHWEPVSFRYYKEDGGREKFQAAFITVSALMLIAGLGISIYSDPAIRMMASRPFHAAAGIVPILTLGLILNSLASFFSFGFFVSEHTKLYGVSQYVTGAVLTVAYVVLIPRFGLEGAVLGQCVAFAFKFGLLYFWSKRYYDPEFNLVPLGFFLLIAAAAYFCSNVLLHTPNVALDLAARSVVVLVASTLIAIVGLRAIKSASPPAFENLRVSFDRFRRGGVAR